MTEATNLMLHTGPVWRDKADVLVNIELEDEPGRFEQLWTRRLDENRFEVCCIPFFAYDLALGDVVTIKASADSHFVVDSVIERSGRYVFRVWFGELGKDAPARDEVVTALGELGGLTEWYSPQLMAVDAVDGLLAQAVSVILQDRELAGVLEYETGLT